MEVDIIKTVLSSAGTSGVVFILAYYWVRSVTESHRQDQKDWNEYLKGQVAFNAELLRLVIGAVNQLATSAAKKNAE